MNQLKSLFWLGIVIGSLCFAGKAVKRMSDEKTRKEEQRIAVAEVAARNQRLQVLQNQSVALVNQAEAARRAKDEAHEARMTWVGTRGRTPRTRTLVYEEVSTSEYKRRMEDARKNGDEAAMERNKLP